MSLKSRFSAEIIRRLSQLLLNKRHHSACLMKYCYVIMRKKLLKVVVRIFFVLFDQTVYSPSEDCILIGITRKYVLKAMLHAGLHYQEKTFALSDLVELQGRARREGKDFAVFVTSSPFDILPIKSISEFEFYSASSSKLQSVAQYYKEIVDFYIQSRQSDHTTRQ